jgi:hypothetical protein
LGTLTLLQLLQGLARLALLLLLLLRLLADLLAHARDAALDVLQQARERQLV